MKRIAIIALVSVLTASCVAKLEGLDQSPLDKESESTYFKDASQMEALTNYHDHITFFGPVCSATKDLLLAKSPSTLMRGGALRTTPSSGGGWEWNNLARINALLDHLGNCPDEATRTLYEAYGRFFRAYFYYYKVRDFGDVPFYDHELGVSEYNELYKARDSRDYIMGKMLEDVDFAIANLPSGKDLYHVTKWTAMAFKSRFCLFEGTWRKYHGNTSPSSGEVYGHDADYYLKLAADVSSDFIDNAPYSIYTTGHPEIDYTHVFNQPTSNETEVILAKSYSITLQVSHFATYDTFGTASSNSFSKKFVDAFLMADGSRFTDRAGWETMEYYDETTGRDPRLGQIIRVPGYKREGVDSLLCADFNHGFTGYQPVKYAFSWKDYPSWGWGPQDNDMPIYRAAEVYLNYAEAMAERSDVHISQADLDKSIKPLRDRAGMPALSLADANANPDDNYMGSSAYGYDNVTGPDKGVILEIRRERMVELAMEGDFRWYDLMRWKQGRCVDQKLYGMYFPGLGSYDFDHVTGKDGNPHDDIYIYKDAADKNNGPAGVPVFHVGEAPLFLTDGTSGYVNPYNSIRFNGFNEERDYLYPIPTSELRLNQALLQNPGWKDIKRK